eukprot:NODE_336_length_10675_cov_0.185136.p8 type:complete len:111 gc:universal NODE_336_length_10675_cov_0.185136:5193-4861(-)
MMGGASQREAQRVLTDVQERHQDLMNIEKSLIEMHQLFLDLSLLVNQQGDMIARIDTNVNAAVDYTEKGVQEMDQALKQQKKNRKRMCYSSICMLFILIILAVVLTSVLA